MSKLHFLAVAAVAILISGAVHAAGPARGGGGGRGGGGAHAGGGGHGGGGGGRHFGGGGGGGARHFSGRPAASRSASRPSVRSNRSATVRSTPNSSDNRRDTFTNNRSPALGQNRPGDDRNARLRSDAVRSGLNSRAVAGALHNRGALHNPRTRAAIAASAATAGWHHGRDGRGGGNGWWRHGNGGYGWVGPLFWPFAYYDMYDYAMWGDGDDASFWGYGYNDIYAGMFAPYGYDDLTGYLPSGGGSNSVGTQTSSTSPAANPEPDQLAQMCGEDSRDIAGLPIDRIQQAIQPNDAQRTALDDLGNASVKAAQGIKTACPTQISLTAPNRLAAMQTRIEAMIAAVRTVQPAMDNFYGLLNDEQKARLNALGQDQYKNDAAQNAGGSIAQSCSTAQPGATDWPGAEIDATVHPTDAQRASLAALQDASAKAADMLKASCQIDAAATPPARLAAVGKRLDVMLQAVTTVRTALDDFYGKLSDEQKAQFEAIGPGRTASSGASSGQPVAAQAHRRHHASIGGIVRRLISFAR
jgi:LTXXQ motif family protein